jgi:sensor c-di-GMP phosphodiesterase-like protein
MTALRHRILLTLGLTLLAALCGAAVGYWAGRVYTLRLTASQLSREAAKRVENSVTFSRDAHRVLDAMNASTEPICSDADMEQMLGLVYRSLLVKQAGRVRDGKIACSTALGRLHLPGEELPQPDTIGADGVKVLRNAKVFYLNLATVVGLQEGNSFVVLNPYINVFQDRITSPLHFKTTVIDAAQTNPALSARSGAAATGPLTNRDVDGRVGDLLYSTRCTVRYSTCITASFSVPEALKSDPLHFQGAIGLGGVTGAWLGLVGCLAYRRNRGMEQQLRRAIRQDKLRVFYQPIVNIADGRIVGAEALARWTDEDDLMIRPDVFVRLAEERGFVEEITKLVLRHVLRDFAETFRLHPDFTVSVNVAASDLADPGFLPSLALMLDRAGVHARNLSIEITESSTAQRQEAMNTIRSLRLSGHSVHIDDFGTGYSSLSYLHALSVDAIKIDRAFTQAIGTEAVTLTILPQILAMAAALDLQVIVEGVETSQQANYFSPTARPIFAQGWLFARAVPLPEFRLMLAQQTPPPA